MPPVTKRGRLFDIAALACILAGAAMCYGSNSQLADISKYSYRHPGPPSISLLTAADHARYLAYGGLATIGAGIAIGVAGVLILARRKKQAA